MHHFRACRPRGDAGVALVYAIAIVGLVGIMMLTLVSISISDGKQTGRDRARSQAVTSAEGAVDLALAQVQSAALADIHCGGTVTNVEAVPDSMEITTTVQFYASNGSPLTCPPAADVIATQALIKSVSVATPAGGGSRATRSVETLVQLSPKMANDLDKAIFGNSGITIGQNFDLYGQSGPDADIYTNGDFSCDNNQRFRGSVIAQGTITLANKCTIDVDAWSRNGVMLSNVNSVVSGDVLVSHGNATISAGTVGGRAQAVDVLPDSWCTANPAKCVEGEAAAPPPTHQDFPQLKGDDVTIAAWVEQGYTVVNLSGCTATDDTNPGRWITNRAHQMTQKTLIRTPCRVTFPTSASQVKLAQDLAVFADRGVSISQSLVLSSTDTTVRQLHLVHPYDFTDRVPESCATVDPGIGLTQLVQMTSTLKELLYSPCNIVKRNQGVLTGQVYGGGYVDIGQQSNVTYAPMTVFGVVSQNIVESYTADVLYKRENVG
jgi:Tfp pilus assembly protein PilX